MIRERTCLYAETEKYTSQAIILEFDSYNLNPD